MQYQDSHGISTPILSHFTIREFIDWETIHAKQLELVPQLSEYHAVDFQYPSPGIVVAIHTSDNRKAIAFEFDGIEIHEASYKAGLQHFCDSLSSRVTAQ